MITKAIIPISGWGTRRLPITKAIEKSMLPVCNRPLVDYSVQDLVTAGVKDIYFVVNDAKACQVRDYYSENPDLEQFLLSRGKSAARETLNLLPADVSLHFLAHKPLEKYGTALPIALVVEQFALNEPVFVFMGDDFIWNPGGPSAAESLLAASSAPNASPTAASAPNSSSETSPASSPVSSAILGVEIDKREVEKYGVLSVENDRLAGIVEKPSIKTAPSNLINVSKYLMTPDLLQTIVAYVHSHDFKPGDQEYLLTDPLADYVQSGGQIRVARTSGEFLDGGTLPSWLHANEVVYKSLL